MERTLMLPVARILDFVEVGVKGEVSETSKTVKEEFREPKIQEIKESQ